MAAAPSKAQISQALRNAQKYIDRLKHLPGTIKPRYIQASNGEGAIVFDVFRSRDGKRITDASLTACVIWLEA